MSHSRPQAGRRPGRPEHSQPPLQAAPQAGRPPPHSLARSQAHMCHVASGTWRPPETGPAYSVTRLDNHDPRPLLALDTQHGKARRRWHGRSFGIESTADVLLTKPLARTSGLFFFTGFAGKKESRRADSNR